ncbi:MAG: hypothetical protein WKG00_31560 [Polyangiaceae bacterium]
MLHAQAREAIGMGKASWAIGASVVFLGLVAADGNICGDNDDCCRGWCLGGSCSSQCGGYEDSCHFTPNACCPGYECYEPNDFALCQKVGCKQEGGSCSQDSDCCFTAWFCISGTCQG